MPKKAIYRGYSGYDCEVWYSCPICKSIMGNWTIYHQKPNENGTKHYCPFCKTELIFDR